MNKVKTYYIPHAGMFITLSEPMAHFKAFSLNFDGFIRNQHSGIDSPVVKNYALFPMSFIESKMSKLCSTEHLVKHRLELQTLLSYTSEQHIQTFGRWVRNTNSAVNNTVI